MNSVRQPTYNRGNQSEKITAWQTLSFSLYPLTFNLILARMAFDRIMDQAGLPGSKMIPAAHAMRSVLGLKLYGCVRHSHVISYVLHQGLALFVGLNAIPKRAFLTE
jgi:hypothetical protein